MRPAVVAGLAVCPAIMAIGARFILSPRVAMLGYGVQPDSLRALTAIKGVRDITSGVVPIVVWRAAGPRALGWVLVAMALIPAGDAVIVHSTGGRLADALGIHGVTAAYLVVVGLLLTRT
jgi:hypothetical protein